MINIITNPTSFEMAKKLADLNIKYIKVQTKLSIRRVCDFSMEQIVELNEYCKDKDTEIVISIDNLFLNENIEEIENFIDKLVKNNINRVCFNDVGVYQIIRNTNNKFELFIDTQATITNSGHVNFWNDLGVDNVFLARELTLKDISNIINNSKSEIIVFAQGVFPMFQTRRELLNNFSKYRSDVLNYNKTSFDDMNYLYDNERKKYYPVFEDEYGTHIMSFSEMCSINLLDKLISSGVKNIYIENLMKNDESALRIIELYISAISIASNNLEKYKDMKEYFIEEISKYKVEKLELDKGFLFKKTIYKIKGDK